MGAQYGDPFASLNYSHALGAVVLLVFCACVAGLCAAMLFVERPR